MNELMHAGSFERFWVAGETAHKGSFLLPQLLNPKRTFVPMCSSIAERENSLWACLPSVKWLSGVTPIILSLVMNIFTGISVGA